MAFQTTDPALSTESKAFTALASQRKTTEVPRVFLAKANTEYDVFAAGSVTLFCVLRTLRKVAYARELESLDTKSSVDWVGVRQIISLYRADKKHLPCK